MATATITPTGSVPEPETTTASLAVLLQARHRITVEEYHRMAEAGIYGPESRIELLEGVLVEKMTKYPPHVLSTDLIDDLLHRLVPPGYFVSMGNPVTIEERDSEPEPDASVIRGQMRDYTGRRRTQADAALVIEVAESSYKTDASLKRAIYAAVRVPVYWIVDLNRHRLEVHTEPFGTGLDASYARTQILGPEDEVPLILDGREVARFVVKEILP